MAGSQNLVCLSFLAAADLSAAQYCAVKLDTNGKVVLAGAGEDAIGVLQNSPSLDQVATVAVGGVSLMKAGGAVAVGLVQSGANGVVAVAVTTKFIIGHALNAATAANQHIAVLLHPYGAKVP